MKNTKQSGYTNVEMLCKKQEAADRLIFEQQQLIQELKYRLAEVEKIKREYQKQISQNLKQLHRTEAEILSLYRKSEKE